MNTELSQIMNDIMLAPFVFIIMCMALFYITGALLYYLLLERWLPQALAKLISFVGLALILMISSSNYDLIRELVADWTLMGMGVGFVCFIVLLGVVGGLMSGKKKHGSRKSSKSVNTGMKRKSGKSVAKQRPHFSQIRSDEVIISSPLNAISGAEFERLLALYFRDQGYEVHEVGVGGKDGGVDLVIIDKRGEKTAVQAKCYADHHMVGVPVVRELVGAKRNHDCILSLLVTTSDLTGPAKQEAEQFKVDYWHGGVVEQKLKAWGKWCPNQKKAKVASTANSARNEVKLARTQVAASAGITCGCGAPMVARKGREGKPFYGCSTYPKCRNTKLI